MQQASRDGLSLENSVTSFEISSFSKLSELVSGDRSSSQRQ
nr:hypothetical protein [Hydrococcus rivularis]